MQNLKIKNLSLYDHENRRKINSFSKQSGRNGHKDQGVQSTLSNDIPYENKISRSQLRNKSKESFTKIENSLVPLMKKLSDNNQLVRRAATQNKKRRTNIKSGFNPFRKLVESQLSNYENKDKSREFQYESTTNEGKNDILL